MKFERNETFDAINFIICIQEIIRYYPEQVDNLICVMDSTLNSKLIQIANAFEAAIIKETIQKLTNPTYIEFVNILSSMKEHEAIEYLYNLENRVSPLIDKTLDDAYLSSIIQWFELGSNPNRNNPCLSPTLHGIIRGNTKYNCWNNTGEHWADLFIEIRDNIE